MTPRTVCALLVALVLLASSCGDSDGNADPGPGSLDVTDVWGRPSPAVAEAAAFYMDVHNNTDVDDVLTAASSARCTRAELHNTQMNDGVMSMAPAGEADLTVVAGGSLVLEPGGLHVMCMGVTSQLELGEEIELQLEFQNAGTIDVVLTVSDGAS